MLRTNITEILLKELEFEPTQDQSTLMQELDLFHNDVSPRSVFLLKGYAGTGKTTMVAVLINGLKKLRKKTVLLAPTGRAAKVLASYAGKEASTIHKKIYFQKSNSEGASFVPQRNLHRDTLFIVDEASMIGDSGGVGGSFVSRSRSLLDDLMDYVFEGYNCKLLLVGDIAQLPPVGLDVSPALDTEKIKYLFSLNLYETILTQVVRQQEESGILINATAIRDYAVGNESGTPEFLVDGYNDFCSIFGDVLEDEINDCYSHYGLENTLIITRSNKRANLFNQQIRARVLWHEDEISTGDLMMVVKNNYFWSSGEDQSFIANGEIIQLERVNFIEDKFGFRFADCEVRLKDYSNLPEFNVKLLLNSILADGPDISKSDNSRLYEEVLNSYESERSKTKKRELLKKDPYYNALHVKFAYAVTCHKSQGGQWDAVFVEQGYITDEMINQEWSRWLYTAITRAKEKLYLLNFHPKFIQGEHDD